MLELAVRGLLERIAGVMIRIPRFLAVLLTLWCLPGAVLQAAAKRPNVLFISIDDFRPELGCYGNEHIISPNIDKVAREGIVFNEAYCQVPVCGPSRASLLTGVRPDSKTCKIWKADQFAPGVVTLPQAFKEAGYHTISNSKIFHGPEQAAERSWSEKPTGHATHGARLDPESENFMKKNHGPFFESPDVPDDAYLDGQTLEKSIGDLQRLAAMDKPFFLAVGFVRPHLPFYAPKKYWDLYDRETIAIADNPFRPKGAPDSLQPSTEMQAYHYRGIEFNSPEFHRTARHGYYACVSYVDSLVGKLMATLDKLELRDDTIVVIWGDHGWHLGEHNFWSKHTLLHDATRVPLIVRAPGFEGNIRTDGIVELLDLYPTLCELADIEAPAHLDGKSAVPLMHDPGREWKEAAFVRFDDGVNTVTKDYTYTEYPGDQRMLYNRKKDPEENENTVERGENQETVERLSGLINSRNGQSD